MNVPNRPPVGVDSIPALELFRGNAGGVEVPVYFADPDDDRLGYAVATSDTAVATTRVSGDSVIVSAAAQGKATVTVTVTDPGGLSAEQRFAVTVPNRAPVVSDTIPEWDIFPGELGALDLSQHFTDLDGESLAFAAETSDSRRRYATGRLNQSIRSPPSTTARATLTRSRSRTTSATRTEIR